MDHLNYFNARERKECEYVVENCDSNEGDKNDDGFTWIELACKTENYVLFDAYKNYYEILPNTSVCSALKYGSIDMLIYCLEYEPHDVEFKITCLDEDIIENFHSPSIYTFPIKYQRPEILQFLFDNEFECNNRYESCDKNPLEYAINQKNPNLEIINIILNYKTDCIAKTYSKAIKNGCSMDIINLFNRFDMITEVKKIEDYESNMQIFYKNGETYVQYNKILLDDMAHITNILANVFSTKNEENINMYLENVIYQFGIKRILENEDFLFKVFENCSLQNIQKACNFLYDNGVDWHKDINHYIGHAMNNKIESFMIIWNFINNFKFNVFTKMDKKYAIIDHAIQLSYNRNNPNIYKTVLSAMFKKDEKKCKKYTERAIQMISHYRKDFKETLIEYVKTFIY